MTALVSAIMPVRGRQQWARQAVDSFLSQDWPNKELHILQDADDLTFDEEWTPPAGVFLHHLSERWTIARKRNRLVDLAAGEFVVHFDSDDWSAPERISGQAAVLLDTNCTLTGYRSVHFWDGAQGYLWTGQPGYVIGSSMFYRKDWGVKHRFPEKGMAVDAVSGIEIGSDNIVIGDGARENTLVATPALGKLVMRVHPGNSSKKHPQNYRKVDRSDIAPAFMAIAAAPSRTA